MSRMGDIRQLIASQNGSNGGLDFSSMNATLANSANGFAAAKEHANRFSENLAQIGAEKEQAARRANAEAGLQATWQNSSNPAISYNGQPTAPQNTQNNSVMINGNPPASGGNGTSISGGLAALLAKHEGGGNYDTLFGHAQRDGGKFAGTKVSSMTLNQLSEFANPRGAYGQYVASRNRGVVATPMGAGQIVGSTLNRTAKQMGLSGDTVFTPEVQNNMINYLAQQRINGARNMSQALAGLRSEWEGFKRVPDSALMPIISSYSGGRF